VNNIKRILWTFVTTLMVLLTGSLLLSVMPSATADVSNAHDFHGRVDVCHKTGNDWVAINISRSAWPAHKAQGDYLIPKGGQCPPPPTCNTVTKTTTTATKPTTTFTTTAYKTTTAITTAYKTTTLATAYKTTTVPTTVYKSVRTVTATKIVPTTVFNKVTVTAVKTIPTTVTTSSITTTTKTLSCSTTKKPKKYHDYDWN
jgi:hypothetical protein